MPGVRSQARVEAAAAGGRWVSVRRPVMGLVLATLMTAAACAQPAPMPTTQVPATATTPPTSTSTPTPTPATADYSVTGCGAPPVTFALLCDVYGYLEAHYVDVPLDTAALAAATALGVEGYRGEAAEPVTAFQCAIPDPAFESTCLIVADRVAPNGYVIEEAIEAGVAAMVDLSLDPFTHYFPPELSGAVSPEGIVLDVSLLLKIRDRAGSECVVVQAPCRLEVAAALPDGPAYAAGLRPGDEITAIDGAPVEGLGLVDAAGLLSGAPGTSVTIETGSGGESASFRIVRDSPRLPTVQLQKPRPDVGYVRIPDFDLPTPAFVHTALGSLVDDGAIDTIVVDLRDNPWGYLDVVTLVASEFLAEGTIFRTIGPEGELAYPAQPGGTDTAGVDLVVVVNGGSASAAEILAAALQERGRATVVGAPTFGKNTVQIGFPLRNDGEIRLTIARWVTPDGASVAPGGLIPDVVVDIPAEATVAEVVDLALGG